ncbi:hypothetical protein KUTeg_024587 [Tegillarca granosa]|uniref:Vacuolar protein-sorting-associated protein 36 n=1 Tax=Tegillarca granosa TaxID=220873 RepID=A0ABQ9DXS1_TEGGR|nr:hypothetical protein KUTeg_024587 [Tegillarca granosa]
MDRFEWSDGNTIPGESFVLKQNGVAIYDGQDKTSFENGSLILTTHKLVWKDNKDKSYVLALPLSLVVYIEEQPSGFARSAKIVVHLSPAPSNKASGPATYSAYSYIRLSFRESGEREFHQQFTEQLHSKKWEQSIPDAGPTLGQGARHRAGIMGIERSLKQRQKDTDQNISVAFQDLSKLIDKAKDMVSLTKSIANKIKDKHGDITDDEEVGGIMTLTDVYCRVNRARGMELLSPEDLLNACEMLEYLNLPVRLRTFDSGVMVLQLKSHSEEEVIDKTMTLVEEKKSVTAEELSQIAGVSVILAKERLLLTEKVGGLCRDETVEGLRFYPNMFLNRPD